MLIQKFKLVIALCFSAVFLSLGCTAKPSPNQPTERQVVDWHENEAGEKFKSVKTYSSGSNGEFRSKTQTYNAEGLIIDEYIFEDEWVLSEYTRWHDNGAVKSALRWDKEEYLTKWEYEDSEKYESTDETYATGTYREWDEVGGLLRFSEVYWNRAEAGPGGRTAEWDAEGQPVAIGWMTSDSFYWGKWWRRAAENTLEPKIVRYVSGDEVSEVGTMSDYKRLLHAERVTHGGGIPAIESGLIRDKEDKDKFELLLLLSRDIDFSVHKAAITAMRVYYGFETDWGIMPEERLRGYEKAKLWWAGNKDQLYWAYQQKMFVPIPD
ncbi:MAG: hypothetical protein L3J82_01860 [Planctomycetes bacterium]|nr:hypothetical protein [Planctomycetota bacterium]